MAGPPRIRHNIQLTSDFVRISRISKILQILKNAAGNVFWVDLDVSVGDDVHFGGENHLVVKLEERNFANFDGGDFVFGDKVDGRHRLGHELRPLFGARRSRIEEVVVPFHIRLVLANEKSELDFNASSG